MPAVSTYSPSPDPFINGVLGADRWAVSNLTYSFPAAAAYYGSDYGFNEPNTGFASVNSAQQFAAEQALAMISSVANLAFSKVVETSTVHGDIRLAMSDAGGTAWGYYPHTADEGGDVWFNRASGNYSNPVKGSYAWATVIHELGHAMGLQHPHDGNVMPVSRDSLEYSIMSYRSFVGASTITGYLNEFYAYPQTLMMYDIAALQYMYGANYNTNNGDTVYSWSPTSGQMFVNGSGLVSPVANRIFLTVWDGGGTDTYDFSNYTTGLSIDLRPGEWTTTSNVQLARLNYLGSQYAEGNIANALLYGGNTSSLIENAIGGSGNDTITGNQAPNLLAGGSQTVTWGAYGAVTRFGDVNGDGRFDVGQIEQSGSIGIWLSGGTALNSRAVWGSGSRPGDQFGDFNGDGRDDIIQLHENGQQYVWLSNGTGFNNWSVWGAGSRPTDRIGDFNGDGRDDIIELHENGNQYVWLSNGSSFNNWTVWGSGSRPTDQIGDFNGDGRDDIIELHENGRQYVWLSTGSGFGNWSVWGSGSRPSDKIGDFNGDGRDDIVELNENGRIYVWLSTGSSFGNWSVWGAGARPSDQIGDFNGDGRDDIIELNENGRAYVWLSNGSGFNNWSVWANGIQPTDRIADMNGDGRDDLVRFGDDGTAYVGLSTGSGFGAMSEWGTGVVTGPPSGKDTFVFHSGFGHDTIRDFEAGSGVVDVIRFVGGLFSGFADLLAHTADNGSGDAVISYDASNTVTLLNVAKTDLVSDDFSFT